MAEVDRSSRIPYYVQVKNSLHRHIESGEWGPGTQLPGEPDLCDLFGVSRTVIRQALREMEYEGLVVRKKGKGTFVAEPKISENLAQRLTGFYQDMAEQGHPPESQVLTQQVVPANAKIAERLQIQPASPVITIVRLRYVQDEPIVLVTSYLPADVCRGLLNADLTRRSLYVLLESECGLVLAHGHRTIEAVPASDYEARMLQVKAGAPLIMLNSVSYLEDETPVEYYHALHRGDRSRFEVELIRTGEADDLIDALITEDNHHRR